MQLPGGNGMSHRGAELVRHLPTSDSLHECTYVRLYVLMQLAVYFGHLEWRSSNVQQSDRLRDDQRVSSTALTLAACGLKGVEDGVTVARRGLRRICRGRAAISVTGWMEISDHARLSMDVQRQI